MKKLFSCAALSFVAACAPRPAEQTAIDFIKDGSVGSIIDVCDDTDCASAVVTKVAAASPSDCDHGQYRKDVYVMGYNGPPVEPVRLPKTIVNKGTLYQLCSPEAGDKGIGTLTLN